MQADSAEDWLPERATEDDGPYSVFKNWEKRRLLYNALLIPWTLLLITRQPGATSDPTLWEDVILGGLAANVCFCLGPVLEAYLVWMGASPRTARGWLFALGTGFTALGALVALA